MPAGSETKTTPTAIAAATEQAASRIYTLARRTPLDYSPQLSAATGVQVHCKLENLQRTGSFKLRGATNRLMTFSDAQRDAGCVIASSGNHGAASACAMQHLGVHGVIFVPEQTSAAKVNAIRSYGGDVQFFGTDGLDTENHARQYAVDNGMTYLSPYNDVEVIAGQGTCGLEIIEQLADVDVVFVAVGGGGLISGIASVIKRQRPEVQVIACQPENSAVMAQSLEAGRILDLESEKTLSDGTAGGIEADAITFGLCQQLIDRSVVVSEADIAAAMRAFIDAEHQLVEGAAGVALAGLFALQGEFKGKKAVVVMCGANISRDTLQSVLGEDC